MNEYEPVQSPPEPPKKPKRRWGLIIFVVLLCGGLGFSLLLNLVLFTGLAMSGSTPVRSTGRAEDQFPTFEERWSFGTGKTKVVRIGLQGMIARQTEGGFLMPAVDFTEQILQQIRAAYHDEKVKAIIMEIDSPGGMIGPSDEIYHALMRFKAREDQPKVFSFTRDLAASGGYYVALAADQIMAEPTAVVGSIGVIMQSLNMKGLSEKIGVEDVTIKSGKNKDLLNPFKTPEPEQLTLLQEVIDDMYDRFRSIVAERRGLDDAALDRLADGRIFSAELAMQEGLIDGIGYWQDVLDEVQSALDAEGLKVVRYSRQESFWDKLGQVEQPDLRSFLDAARPRFMFLWQP